MGTSFEEIYCINSVIKTDPTIIRLPIYQYYSLCYKQLQFAITAFMYDCLKDISAFIPYTEQEYNFIGNGIDVEFQVIPVPESYNTSVYVGIYDEDNNIYVENHDYIYIQNTSKIVFDKAPLVNSKVLIAFYNIGSFTDTLDVDEITILAEAMNIPYLERYQNNIRSLNQIIYSSKSYSIHSQAEQLKQLSNLSITQWRDRVGELINKYSYRKPKDKLIKLGSRRK